jgi:hypothetical protein
MSVAVPDCSQPVAERAKELLADPRLRIALDGFVNKHLRAALEVLSPARFPLTGGEAKDFKHRVAAYEDAIRALLEIVILLARWGDVDGRLQLEKILSRLAETAAVSGGAVPPQRRSRSLRAELVAIDQANGFTLALARRGGGRAVDPAAASSICPDMIFGSDRIDTKAVSLRDQATR